MPLGSAREALIDHRGKTPKKLCGDWSATGHRVVSALNIKNSTVDDNEHHYISDDLYENWMKIKLQAGDVILTSEAPTGEVAYLAHDYDWALGQRVFGLRGKKDVLDGRFLYYALRGGDLRHDLMSRTTGTTVQGIRQAELVKVEINLPPLPEQRAIAATLGALDDKIESNRQICVGAVNLSGELFSAALLRGRRTVTIGDVADFHNRRRIPLSSAERSQRAGSIPYYGATGVFGYVDEALFNEVLVLVGEDGSVVREDGGPVLQYIWGPAWINNHAHPLSGRGISNETLYMALNRADIRPIVTGAVQPKVNMRNLKSLPVELPRDLGTIEGDLSALFALYKSKQDEVVQLAALRDSLLPELLSGRIRVPFEGVET